MRRTRHSPVPFMPPIFRKHGKDKNGKADSRGHLTPPPLTLYDTLVGYTGCALVNLMPVLAAGFLLVNPTFFRISLAATIGGLIVSMVIRPLRPPRPLVGSIVIAVTIVASLTYLQTTSAWRFLLHPGSRQALLALGTTESYIILIHLFLVFLVVRTYSLLTENDWVLSIIPGLSTTVLLCLFQKGLTMVPFFIPFALGVVMLLLFSHRREMDRQREPLGKSVESTPEDTAPVRRRHGMLLGLRAMIAITLLAIGLSAGFTFGLRGNLPRPALLDQLGYVLAQRIATHLLGMAKPSYVAPVTTLSMDWDSFPVTRRELFQVTAAHPAYWRGTSLNRYTGRGWSRSHESPQRYALAQGTAMMDSRDSGILAGIPTERFSQQFEVMEFDTGILFGAYEAASISGDIPAIGRYRSMPLRVDSTSSMLFTGTLRAGNSYSVVSRVKAPPDETSSSMSSNAEAIPAAIAEKYLPLPALPERLVRLGRSFRKPDRTSLETARAISKYVAKHLHYNVNPPYAPWPQDVVDYILFESHAGYCSHYASALAVLCRLAGVPSRVISGFAPGEYDTELGVFHVRETDWHAWVEVFLPGYGWYEMDASPVVDLDAVMHKKDKPAWIAALGAWAQRTAAIIGESHLFMGLVWLMGGSGVALIVLYMLRHRRQKVGVSLCATFPPAEENVRKAYRRMCRVLSRKFRAKLAAETPNEYLTAVEQWLGRSCPPATQLTSGYVSVTYASPSHTPPSPRRLNETIRQLTNLLEAPRGAPGT